MQDNDPHHHDPEEDDHRPDPMIKKALTPPFHRLRQVRRQKEIPEEFVASRLRVDVSTVKRQERESSDIRLGLLHRWQEVLEVPLRDLLVDHDEPSSEAIALRELLESTIKTAIQIAGRSRQPLVTHMARNMINQVLEIMPELRGMDPRRDDPCPVDEFGHLVENTKAKRPPLEFDE